MKHNPGSSWLGESTELERMPITMRYWIIRYWLALCWLMVAAMILIGGYTRLSGSGLSIVEWHPFGFLPPLNHQQWLETFMLYQNSPEYQIHHPDMNLGQFQAIFWPEYIHRLWGRMMGVVFLFPLIVFLACGWMNWRDGGKLGGIFLLGAAQGLLGWYMVKSGLSGQGEVSHYRLVAHLGLALVIYGLLLRMWFAFQPISRAAASCPFLRKWIYGTVTMVFITLLSGAMVSGLDAGSIHNTFPLMGSNIFPADFWALSPWYINVLDNPSAVQFLHRILAVTTVLLAVTGAISVLRQSEFPLARKSAWFLLSAALFQGLLGIMTLLHGAPLSMSMMHQAGGIVLFSAALLNLWVFTPPHDTSHHKSHHKPHHKSLAGSLNQA